MLDKLFKNIFSITTNYSRKEICILGVKLKLFCAKEEIHRQDLLVNKNTIQFAYNLLFNAEDDDLFCLRAHEIIFIFHKGCLNLQYKFFQDYVIPSGHTENIIEFHKLNKNSILYKEHIDRVKNGEFLWKYVERYYYIGHSFISKDKKTGEIYINSSYVQEKIQLRSDYKLRHIPSVSKRKYLPGIAVDDYISNKPFAEKMIIIDKLLNYIFTTYRAKDDPNKVCGNLADCHLHNFVIGEDGQFHFIDFDLKCDESLDRNYCIYFMLYKYNQELYYRFLKRYGFKDKHKYYERHMSIYKQPLKQNGRNIITREHMKLKEKYFSDIGINEEYKLNYKKVSIN